MKTRRGTTNSNARGNTRGRAARKLYLLKAYASDLPLPRCRRYRCGEPLALDEITVDRIKPGAKGGRYVRSNIRPACARCNSETGGAVRG